VRDPPRVAFWFLEFVDGVSEILSDLFIMGKLRAKDCVASSFLKVGDVRRAIKGRSSGVRLFEELRVTEEGVGPVNCD
jgi:hypothetical protein